MDTSSVKKRSYLRSINQAIPMKDNVIIEYEQEEQSENAVNEPGIGYVACPDQLIPCLPSLETDIISEVELSDEEIEARLEAFFVEQRELLDSAPIPEECAPMEEAYQKTIKHLEELYAKKKSRVNA